MLFALACLGIGLFGSLFSITFLAGEVPGWAIAVGLFSVACLALGGKILWGLWMDEPEPEEEEAPAQLDTREQLSEAKEAADDANDEKDAPSALTGLLSAVIRAAGTLWLVVFASAALLGGLYLSQRTLHIYYDKGFGSEAAAFGGFTLLIFAVLGVFALRWWRHWRESRHTYAKLPGAYRRAWRTDRIQATGFRSNIELLGGLTSTRIESWRNVLIGALASWTVVVLLVYFMLWPGLQEGPIGLALVQSGMFLVPAGSIALYSTYLLYKATRHRRQHAPAVFVMDPMPAVLGGTLRGTVETNLSFENWPSDGFQVELTCYKRRTGNDTDRRASYHTLWHEEKEVPGRSSVDGSMTASIAFALPDDRPPSTLERTTTRVVWRLTIRADDATPPYEQYFDVPVFPADAPVRSETATSTTLDTAHRE